MRDEPPARGNEADLLTALVGATPAQRASLWRWAAARHAGRTLEAQPLSAGARAELDALARRARPLAARERELAAELGARLLTLADDGYPEELRMLDLPPPAIYVHGDLPDAPAVAVVGARRASGYGLEVARWFGRELAAAGVTVVSGFALGVDAAAHRGALETGATVAVLGCGLDFDYPRGQRELAARIAASGARLTEFPIARQPARWHFPVRNRLIAALARACVVVEAAPCSGSLVTARLALELGREVLAVPGRVTDELALGANALIADGARPALDPRDVLEAIGFEVASPAGERVPPGLEGLSLALWRAARAAPASCERLAERVGGTIERALVATLELELLGHLRRRADGDYEALG